MWISSLGANGAQQWQQCYGGRLTDRANSIIPTSNGGYIFVGETFTRNDGDVSGEHLGAGSDIWVVKLSNPLDVRSKTETANIHLISNPISSSADFQFDPLNSSISFQLFDLLGRAIYHEQLPAGQTSFHLDMQKYPSGIYFARLGNETVRFVKE